MVSADHGFMDVTEEKTIMLDKDILDCLSMPPAGESRYGYFYVVAEREKEFETKMEQVLQGHGKLYKSYDLIEEGMFGLGSPHPELEHRLGDYTLIMKDGRIFDYPLFQSEHRHIGEHGGLSEDEMLVPLIFI